MFFIQGLHNVEGPLAQSLTHGVKENQDKVTKFPWK